ncbi:hypothetical protein [Mesorhizobium sp. KR9-304]|uniref:hypothetical protein n=1 Tax=Mesorhizobium sp. KR9-304 TaxID=3156614 RepID=UPI0032B6249B
MNLRSAYLADRGARLAGLTPHFDPCHVPRQETAAPDVIPSTSGAAFHFELTLSDRVQAILHLAAKAAGVEPGELIARAIVFYAGEAVGFPALADELYAPPEERAGASRFHEFRSGGP